MKLTDTHLVLLSAAAQHADRLLVRPDAMADSAAGKLAAKLVRAGLVEQVTAGPHQLSWLVDDGGLPVGIRITAAGLSAIGIADEPAGVATEQSEPVRDPGSPPDDDAKTPGAAAERRGCDASREGVPAPASDRHQAGPDP